MSFYIRLFWQLFLRKETPANVPPSQALMILLIILGFITSALATINNADALLKSLAGNLVDIMLLALFTHFLLDFYKRRARFLPVFIALLGVKVLFQVLAMPGVLYVSTVENLREPNPLLLFSSLFMVVLLIVTLRAMAHIFALAVNIDSFKAVMYSVMYYLINLFVTVQLFAGNQAEAVS